MLVELDPAEPFKLIPIEFDEAVHTTKVELHQSDSGLVIVDRTVVIQRKNNRVWYVRSPSGVIHWRIQFNEGELKTVCHSTEVAKVTVLITIT